MEFIWLWMECTYNVSGETLLCHRSILGNLVMWAHKFLPRTFHPKWRFNVILLCVYVRIDHMNMTSPKRGQVCIRVGLVTSKWYQSWEKRDEKQTRIWSKEDNGKNVGWVPYQAALGIHWRHSLCRQSNAVDMVLGNLNNVVIFSIMERDGVPMVHMPLCFLILLF
jgi:hypothetical protein